MNNPTCLLRHAWPPILRRSRISLLAGCVLTASVAALTIAVATAHAANDAANRVFGAMWSDPIEIPGSRFKLNPGQDFRLATGDKPCRLFDVVSGYIPAGVEADAIEGVPFNRRSHD